GRVDINLLEEPVGYDPNGSPVYLRDIWPTQEEIVETINECLRVEDFKHVYDVIFDGGDDWKQLVAPEGKNFVWNEQSSYVQEAPFFKNISPEPLPTEDIHDARVLLYLGDSVTTDHISPAGSFKADSAAGQ